MGEGEGEERRAEHGNGNGNGREKRGEEDVGILAVVGGRTQGESVMDGRWHRRVS